MALIKVLPASTKDPGPARTGEVTETRHSAKRESGGNIFKTGHRSREREEVGEVRSKERTVTTRRSKHQQPLLILLHI